MEKLNALMSAISFLSGIHSNFLLAVGLKRSSALACMGNLHNNLIHRLNNTSSGL